MDTAEQSILQIVLMIVFFGMISLIISWIAWGKGFYSLPAKEHKVPDVRFSFVALNYLLFIAIYVIFAPQLLYLMINTFSSIISKNNVIMITQLLVSTSSLFLLWVYGWSINRSSFKRIWKDLSYPEAKSIGYDIGIGLLCWFVAFPLVALASEIGEWLTLLIFGHLGNEQVAIHFLKLAIGAPFSLFVALVAILIGAPLLEEYLFRGVLQTWLRRKLSPILSITISSLAFAAFHLTEGQGVGNITLFFSLFVFAMYLGFIYEKQRSLFSNVFLHVTFNLISVIRILTYES